MEHSPPSVQWKVCDYLLNPTITSWCFQLLFSLNPEAQIISSYLELKSLRVQGWSFHCCCCWEEGLALKFELETFFSTVGHYTVQEKVWGDLISAVHSQYTTSDFNLRFALLILRLSWLWCKNVARVLHPGFIFYTGWVQVNKWCRIWSLQTSL